MQWVIGVIIVAAIGVGIFLMQGSNPEDAMMEKDAMMENESVREGDAMKLENGTMKLDGEGAMMDGEIMKDGTDGKTMEEGGDAMMKDEGAMMEKGSYESYAPEKLAKAEEGDVVLFFRASWCPTCRALDADIKGNAGSIPAGLTILDVNYDTETALKQKYGVTTQHTLVQVSSDGTLLKKWQGSAGLEALAAEVI